MQNALLQIIACTTLSMVLCQDLMHAVMLWQVTMSQLRQQKETEKALAEESAKKRELEAKRMVLQLMANGIFST